MQISANKQSILTSKTDNHATHKAEMQISANKHKAYSQVKQTIMKHTSTRNYFFFGMFFCKYHKLFQLRL